MATTARSHYVSPNTQGLQLNTRRPASALAAPRSARETTSAMSYRNPTNVRRVLPRGQKPPPAAWSTPTMDRIGTRNPNEHRVAPRRKVPGCDKWTDNFEGIGKLYVSQSAEDQLLDRPLGPRQLRESMLDRELIELKAHVQKVRPLKGVPNPGYTYSTQVPSGLPSEPQERRSIGGSRFSRHPSESNFRGGSLFLSAARPDHWEDLDCGAPVRHPIDDWTSAMRVHQMSGVAAAEGVRGGTQWLDPANRHGLDDDFHAPPFHSAGATVSLLATQAGKDFFGELVVPGSDIGSDGAMHRGAAGGFHGKDMEDHFDGGSVVLDASVSTDVDSEGFFGDRFAGKDVQDHFEDGGGMVVSEFLDGEGDELHIEGAGEKAAGKRKLVARPQGKKQRASSVTAHDGEGARAALLEVMAAASATNAELLNTLNDEANFRAMRRASYAGDAVAKLLRGASTDAPEKKRVESSKRAAARRASHGGRAVSELLKGLAESEGLGGAPASTQPGRSVASRPTVEQPATKSSKSMTKIITQSPIHDDEHKSHHKQSISMKGGRRGTDVELHSRMNRHSLTLGGEGLRPSDAEMRRAVVKAGHIKRTITDDQTFKHSGAGAHRDSTNLSLVLFNR